MNLLDDSLSADLARWRRSLDAAMHQRFPRLAHYALDCGSDAILFTCSAFGPCIEAVARAHPQVPVLKPNEAMVAEAVALGGAYRPGGQLRAHAGFDAAGVPAGIGAANPAGRRRAGRARRRRRRAPRRAGGHGGARSWSTKAAPSIALAQFSLARARDTVAAACGVPVLTTVDSAVAELRRRLGG